MTNHIVLNLSRQSLGAVARCGLSRGLSTSSGTCQSRLNIQKTTVRIATVVFFNLGVKALQAVLDEPARLLQLHRKRGAVIVALALATMLAQNLGVAGAQVAHDAPVASRLLHDHVRHDDGVPVYAGGNRKLLHAGLRQQVQVLLADQDRHLQHKALAPITRRLLVLQSTLVAHTRRFWSDRDTTSVVMPLALAYPSAVSSDSRTITFGAMTLVTATERIYFRLISEIGRFPTAVRGSGDIRLPFNSKGLASVCRVLCPVIGLAHEAVIRCSSRYVAPSDGKGLVM